MLTSDRLETHSVDLNCDMGEGMPTDKDIFPLISSANIACGGHAGDEKSMHSSVALSLAFGVAIGAHPSYPDKDDFGRTDILESEPGAGDRPFPYSDLSSHLTAQITALKSVCEALGARLRHVKPHGALYNRAAKDPGVSKIICKTIAAIDPSLIIYGLSGSVTRDAAAASGLRFVNEVFADRTYRTDGALTPRTEKGALIHDPAAMLDQVLMMILQKAVRTTAGPLIPILADSICLHGDGENAVKFASIIRSELARHYITVAVP